MTSSDQDYDREGVSKSSNYTLILLESLNLPIICINTIGGTIGLCICIDKYCSGSSILHSMVHLLLST